MNKKKAAKNEVKEDLSKHERAVEVAERMKLLFGFCFTFFEDLDLLKEVAEGSSDNLSRTDAMAPVIEAFGQDYETVRFKKKLEYRRAHALYELIRTLKETEEERAEFESKQEERMKGKAQLARILGGL